MKYRLYRQTGLFVFACIFAAGLSGANAKTVNYTKTVKSGKQVKIDTFMGWNNDCSFQTINIDVVGKPGSGSASANVVNSKITRAQAGSAGKCLGIPIKGLGLFYKSRAGFRGIDRVKIKMKVRGQAPVFFNYVIKVK